MFSHHFLNPAFMYLIDMIDDFGDVNITDCILISLKNILKSR